MVCNSVGDPTTAPSSGQNILLSPTLWLKIKYLRSNPMWHYALILRYCILHETNVMTTSHRMLLARLYCILPTFFTYIWTPTNIRDKFAQMRWLKYTFWLKAVLLIEYIFLFLYAVPESPWKVPLRRLHAALGDSVWSNMAFSVCRSLLFRDSDLKYEWISYSWKCPCAA